MTTRPILDTDSTTTATSTTSATATENTPRPASPPSSPATSLSSSSSLSSRVSASPAATPLYSSAHPLFGQSSTLASSSAVTPEAALHKAWEIITQAQVTDDLNASYKHALMIADETLHQHPKSADLWALKATCHFNLAQYELASEAACKALERDADNGVAMSVLMDCDEARSAPLPIQRLSPPRSSLNDQAFRAALDRILSLEKPDQAQNEIERLLLEANAVLERDSSDTTAFCLKIICSIFQGKMLDMDVMEFLQSPMRADQIAELFEKTRPIVEELLRKKADSIPALVLKMGCVCFDAQRENMKAIFQHVMGQQRELGKEKPENILVLFTGVVDLGQRHFFAEPLAAAQDLLKHDPKNRVGLIVHIEALRMLGRLDEARRMADAVLQDFPEDDFFWTLQALCCLSTNDPRGLKSAHEALRLNPKTNLFAHFIKLIFLCKEKEIDAIIAAVLEAREQFPSNHLFVEFEKYYLSEERMNDKK